MVAKGGVLVFEIRERKDVAVPDHRVSGFMTKVNGQSVVLGAKPWD